MKQIVTIFRAEGRQAARVSNLCRRTRTVELFGLRDRFRDLARSGNQFTAYMEFLDPWAMGDSFDLAMGADARERSAGSGSVYWTGVSAKTIEAAKLRAKKRHQFNEDARLQKCIADLMTTPFLRSAPITLVLFREIVGGSVLDDEFEDGSKDIIKAPPSSCASRLIVRANRKA